MDFYAARRPAGQLGAPYDIVRVSADGTTIDTVATPPPGRSFTRPIVAPNGRLAWWEVEQGGSHDSPWSMFGARWWIDGRQQPRPKGWLACGHLEWHPDGQRMVAAAERVAWERTNAPLPDGWTAEVANRSSVYLRGPRRAEVATHRPNSADRWVLWGGGGADTLAELIEQVTR